MFSWFKSNPTKKLERQHAQKLEQAMHAQRNGNIRGYSQLTYEADEIYKKIKELGSVDLCC
uniref:DUF6435 family protein n=1 Tax=Pseudoalteromonas ruthenica TaxID=151081 RepID=UPI00241C88A9